MLEYMYVLIRPNQVGVCLPLNSVAGRNIAGKMRVETKP